MWDLGAADLALKHKAAISSFLTLGSLLTSLGTSLHLSRRTMGGTLQWGCQYHMLIPITKATMPGTDLG